MIPDKSTFPSSQKAIIVPAQTVPAKMAPLPTLDFTKSFIWEDNQGAGTLTAKAQIIGAIVIMGGNSKTPYNPDWEEQDARLALFTQLGLPVLAATAPATA